MIERKVIEIEDEIEDIGIEIGIKDIKIEVKNIEDDIVLIKLERMEIKCRKRIEVEKKGNIVGKLEDLIEIVRNEDRGDEMREKIEKKRKKRRNVILVEDWCWLIEDKKKKKIGKRIGDLKKMMIENEDIGDESIGSLRKKEIFK